MVCVRAPVVYLNIRSVWWFVCDNGWVRHGKCFCFRVISSNCAEKSGFVEWCCGWLNFGFFFKWKFLFFDVNFSLHCIMSSELVVKFYNFEKVFSWKLFRFHRYRFTYYILLTILYKYYTYNNCRLYKFEEYFHIVSSVFFYWTLPKRCITSIFIIIFHKSKVII